MKTHVAIFDAWADDRSTTIHERHLHRTVRELFLHPLLFWRHLVYASSHRSIDPIDAFHGIYQRRNWPHGYALFVSIPVDDHPKWKAEQTRGNDAVIHRLWILTVFRRGTYNRCDGSYRCIHLSEVRLYLEIVQNRTYLRSMHWLHDAEEEMEWFRWRPSFRLLVNSIVRIEFPYF